MKFINRKDEIVKIHRFLTRKSPGLAVIYGRRRCGKSTLLSKAISSKDIYFQADQQEAILQRKHLGAELKTYIPEIDQLSFDDWASFFRTVSARIKGLTTIVLDEFPYLVKASPELPSVLQRLIDKNELTFHLVLCGSAQQLMHGLVLDKDEPLYGRAHLIMNVKPLKAGFIQEALPKLSSIQCIEEYATWGGIPRYWKQRIEYDHLFEAMRELVLDRDALFHEEPIRLLADDLRSSVQAYSILQLIGNGVQKISEISSRLDKPASALSRPVQQLIELNMIARELPYGELEKNSKRGVYKIIDPFLAFYFRFVHSNKSVLSAGLSDRVLIKVKEEWSQYTSGIFEQLVRQAIPYSDIYGIEWGLGYRWWPSASDRNMKEIDLISISSDKKSILIGEVKWENNTGIERVSSELNQKIENLPKEILRNKKVYRALFLKSIPAKAKTNKDLLYFDSTWVLKHNL